jgi:hypothetical protein
VTNAEYVRRARPAGRYRHNMEPRTVWHEQDGVQSGGGGVVRAAAFAIAGSERGAVTFTVQAPSWEQLEGGGVAATLLLNPDEARGFAAWLDAAAAAADAIGPPLYS